MFKYIKVFIKTLGCNINNLESEKIFNFLKYFKIKIKNFFFNCNILILNSCVIRKNPELKVFKEIKKWFFIKKYKKNLILLTGCLTEFNNFEKIKILKIDILFNNICNIYINKLIIFFLKNKKKIFFIKKKINYFLKNKINNYFLIMKGCNHNCSYCVIPQIKGKEYYYSYKYIIFNIIKNIKKNFCEITLLGQNVNSYYYKKIDFNSLLFNISKIKNIKRINFLSSNIKNFNNKFFYLYKNIKKISNHFHIPLQSGSNKILKKMNRKYNLFEYFLFLKNITKIKKTTFSSDIILSFPEENYFEYDNTLKTLKKIKFLDVFFFSYSKRINTISYNFKVNNINNKFKLFLFQKFLIKNKKSLINNIIRVLVIGYIKNNIFIGKMDNFKLIFFEFYDYTVIGNFIKIKIIKNKKNFFLGIYEN
ncbi:isopentenyl-adenosine tRNA methylthiolase [Candidatus Carsonella ruddii HT isolate Thao2000]|uniref:tRNA-2-methylthio-N(6)-dimethylallyladenosine synthase n=1 Tax=Candidatus Carsonella ruddii HT isolate Thao2000 TaxID=1202539 RepID=J3Z1K0_CARRU|nr:MiaB/RimO family radical SAM methylthiotransferase [Candidatus Carsonella ruddii]AFP84144.1 isopentenyl-adenosine tRNA methylthiolase [Candidatus Carsonella ruddii HT isolate Thao2000]